MTLPREGVHHYGQNGEIVEYAPVKEVSVSEIIDEADADRYHREVGLLQIDVANRNQKIMDLSGELSAATASAEKAEADAKRLRDNIDTTEAALGMSGIYAGLEQQRDTAQADCAAMRSELADARRRVWALANLCAGRVLIGTNCVATATGWIKWAANEARKQGDAT